MTRALAFLTAFVICTAAASAQYVDFALSGGYSHFYPDKTGGFNFSKDGAYIDGDFAWRLPGPVPLMLGVGVGASGYWNSQEVTFINQNDFFRDTNLYSDIENVNIEPRLALNFRIPGMPGFVIRPRIGAGLLVNNYSIDTLQTVNTNSFIHTDYFTGAAFEIRPDIEAGFDWNGFSAGLDASYMAAWGNFGSFGNMMQELRVGLFLRLRY